MILANITVLLLAALAGWWLSGYDTKVTGENEKEDLIRRAFRCGITLVLVEIFFFLPFSIIAIPPLLFVIGMLAITWLGCLGELFAGGFHHLIDPEDKPEFDPNKDIRNLDIVASLLKNGRNEEAVQFCQILKESGDANILVLETLLARSGIHFESGRKPKPLTEAYQLRSQGKFNEAEAVLNSLLVENPANVDAALMLMQLYAQDLRRSDKAAEVLRSLQKQPHVSPAYIEYAQRSIHDWGRKKRKPEGVVLPESIDELLALGYLGTAIETLEQKIKEHPGNFDLWMKLAEAQVVHCGNFQRAEKIVQQIEANPAFNPEQVQFAKTKLLVSQLKCDKKS
jgi:tetratricopeptide (TPR) repeat protein